MSHHGLAPKERHLPPVQCHSIARGPITASTTRRARAASSRVLPPPGKQPAQWRLRVGHARAGCAFEVIARTSHHGLAPKERGLPSVQGPSRSEQDDRSQRSTASARAASSYVLRPPERQPAQWRSFASHANAGCALEGTARTSHHGLAPKERGLPPVQCHSVARGPIVASAARRARAASSGVLPPPEKQPAQWRLRVGHAKAGCALEVIACKSHHGCAPQERGLPLAQCPAILRRTIATSAAQRARASSSRVLPPPESQPAQWRLRTCHANSGSPLEAAAGTSYHGLAPKERCLSPVQ